MPAIDRRAADTPRSLAALIAYCELGPTRSLEKLVQIWSTSGLESPPTKWLSTLKRWSSDGSWSDRAAEYDRAIQLEAEAQRSAIRTQRRAELEDLDYFQGMDLRNRVAELLAEMPRFLRQNVSRIERVDEKTKVVTITEVITLALKAGPGELARAMKLASEIQRLSVGEPTAHTAISGPGGEPIQFSYEAAVNEMGESNDESDP